MNVINDGVDIYDGLSGYFDDMVEFEGRKVRMEVTLVDLPPVLQIQLQVRSLPFSIFHYLDQYARGYNSIVRRFSRTNLKHMSNLERTFTWIGS